MRRRGTATWLLAAFAWLCAAPSSHAGDLRLEPVSLSLRADEDSTTLWLTNTGDEPLLARATLFSWRQQDGGEVLGPTGDLAVSPPLLQVPPRGRQRLRLVRLRPEPPATEGAHRLIVEELPAPDGRGGSRDAGTARRRYSIPVFTLPAAAQAPARLVARIDRDAAGGRILRLQNSGGRHARVAGLAWVEAGGRRHMLVSGLAGYVLAGAFKDWPLREDLDGTGHFEADVDGQALQLPPEPPPPAGG